MGKFLMRLEEGSPSLHGLVDRIKSRYPEENDDVRSRLLRLHEESGPEAQRRIESVITSFY